MIRTRVNIWDEDGFESDRRYDDYMSEAYDQQFQQRMVVNGSTNRFQVDLGPVTTVEFLYIQTDEPIYVYRNNSVESWYVGSAFLVVGCSITALHIKSENDATIHLYVAGS